MTDVSIIIPVFNAEQSLALLMERVTRVPAAPGITHEIIAVDDGSADASWELIRRLAERYPQLAGARLKTNVGQHAATLIGLKLARRPFAVTMDDDLQHPPESIPLLLAALNPGVDIVYAGPARRYRSFGKSMVSLLVKHMLAIFGGASLLRRMQTFRALRLSVYPWQGLDVRQDMTVEGILASTRLNTTTVRVPYAARYAGQSTYNFSRYARLALNLLQSARGRKARGEEVSVMEVCGWLQSRTEEQEVPPPR